MADVTIELNVIDGEATCNLLVAEYATHITTEVLMKALVNLAKEIGLQFHADKQDEILLFLKDVVDGNATEMPNEAVTLH